jgi:hypothetical protein
MRRITGTLTYDGTANQLAVCRSGVVLRGVFPPGAVLATQQSYDNGDGTRTT